MPLQFADFTIDADSRLLRQGGTPVHLSRKAFDLLRVLLDRRPGTVTKDELHQHLWPGTFVVDVMSMGPLFVGPGLTDPQPDVVVTV